MKVITIIGARPQFIKAATVSRIIKQYTNIKEVILHTGQHFDSNMSDVFFEELEIPKPDYHLGIGGGNHGEQTGKMLEAIEKVFIKEKPDWVLVYGDTNSTLAGALAAAKLHIPIAHVEAGLRSFNKKMPEEINRILTDHVSTLLFTPTQTAIKNLESEGINDQKIVPVGDVMFDAALFYGKKAESKSTILQELEIEETPFVLTTIHRAENTDNPGKLRSIFSGLEELALKYKVILPLHPRTKKSLNSIGYDVEKSPINFTTPLGYLDMVLLEKHAKIIVTDSGGVQKEAYFHSTPCLTLRDETEWVELVENGYNKLIKDFKVILEEVNTFAYPKNNTNLYGDGNSATHIVESLLGHS